MSQTKQSTADSGRSLARARRQALSSRGKAAMSSRDRTRSTVVPPPEVEDDQPNTPVAAPAGDHVVPDSTVDSSRTRGPVGRNLLVKARQALRGAPAGRALAKARRSAQSNRGKAAVSESGVTPAQSARALDAGVSGRDLAKAVRDRRSRKGAAGVKSGAPCGRQRPPRQSAPDSTSAEDGATRQVGAAARSVPGPRTPERNTAAGGGVTGARYMDAEIFNELRRERSFATAKNACACKSRDGIHVTGNEIGRNARVTGNERGASRDITGSSFDRVTRSMGRRDVAGTGAARVDITGDPVDRSSRVTGNETGAGRQISGTRYADPSEGTAPAKVGASSTLRGGVVTGSLVGRSARVTGNEPGTCRNVTGDDYIGSEQYGEFCETTPTPADRKVGASRTFQGRSVTGTMTGRASRVTGNEPGACKAVTGTPYAGMDQFTEYCDDESIRHATARVRPHSVMAHPITGGQPAIGGDITGDSKGACEPVTGTPYVGADQLTDVCPSRPASPQSPDFPRPMHRETRGALDGIQQSSAAPIRAAAGSSRITGPFGMASGKVTGAGEFRRLDRELEPRREIPAVMPAVEGRVKSRISGEGIDAGPCITGDDWDRGDRVTGTEGTSAVRRNETLRPGPAANRGPRPPRRETPLNVPVSKVTGGSGNTEHGALVTYSGGARG